MKLFTTLGLFFAAAYGAPAAIERDQINPVCIDDKCPSFSFDAANAAVDSLCNHSPWSIAGGGKVVTGPMGWTFGDIDLVIDLNPDCGSIVLNATTCAYNFAVPINQCDYGQPMKHGGIWATPCNRFYVIPNKCFK